MTQKQTKTEKLREHIENGISVAQCSVCGKSGDICRGCAYPVAAGVLAHQIL